MDPNSLYSYMLFDMNIENRPADNYFHYLVHNVRGTNLQSGDVAFKYVPPFYFDYDPRR